MVYLRYITKSTLLNRGWTNGMIKKFFGTPTLSVPNPHYATAPSMKLFSITQVKRIERKQEFWNYMNSIAHKREVAREMMAERHKRAKELILVPHTDGMTNQRA